MFVGRCRSVELWLCSRSAGKPEQLPNEAAYARKKKQKQNRDTDLHTQECMFNLFFLALPCSIMGSPGILPGDLTRNIGVCLVFHW